MLKLLIIFSLTWELTQQGRILYDYKVNGARSDFKIGIGSCFDKKQKVTDIFKDVV